MARLAVNVDHVATVRQARGGREPDPVAAAVMAELAGAEGIICHLREDRRHVQDRDLRVLREVVQTRLNMEMAATDEMIRIAGEVRPELVTLVPEKRQELTTEGGLDVFGSKDRFKDVVRRMHEAGIQVSFFIDPDTRQIESAAECGGDIVEIHTGAYAEAATGPAARGQLATIATAVNVSSQLGLRVSAGHGLNYVNIKRFNRIPLIEEYSIGHTIVARAVLVGFERAVREMLALVRDF